YSTSKVRLLTTSQSPRTESTSTCLTASSFARADHISRPVLLRAIGHDASLLSPSHRDRLAEVGGSYAGGGAAHPCASGHCSGRCVVLRDPRGECHRGRQIGVAAGHIARLPLGEAAPVESIGTLREETQGRVVVGECLGGLVHLEIGQPAVDKSCG